MNTGSMSAMSAQERLDWLRLIRSENVGPIGFHHLLRCYGNAAAALERLPELARKGGRKRRLSIFSSRQADEEMRRARDVGLRMLFLPDAEYPAALRALETAPPILYMLGNAALFAKPCVAMVGSRNASSNAMMLTHKFALELSAQGFVIVSGMARGIDANAHWGALERGTVAVLAGGVDVVYPHSNRELYDRLREQGALLSEMPPGMEPMGRHFPRRNRLISGMSLATLVMEATPQSGSLITARTALEQGREVMAVPGFPSDARSRGTNALIRDGATLVETPEDILTALKPHMDLGLFEQEAFRDNEIEQQVEEEYEQPSDETREQLLSLIGSAPTAIADLVEQSRLPLTQILLLLVELELAGQIAREPAQRVSRLLPASANAGRV